MKRGTHDATRLVVRLTASSWAAHMFQGIAREFEQRGAPEWAQTVRDYGQQLSCAGAELDAAARVEVIEP